MRGKTAADPGVRPICSVCGGLYEGIGHNAWPINDGRCCSKCNEKVTGERIHRYHTQQERKQN